MWHLKKILVLLFSRVKYSSYIMDKHVIIDLSYMCEMLWSSGTFFFSGQSLVTVMVIVTDFYLCVLDMDGNISSHMMQNFVASEPALWLDSRQPPE